MILTPFYNITLNKINKNHYNKLGYKGDIGDIICVKWEDAPSNYDISFKCVVCEKTHSTKKSVILNQKHKFTCKKCTAKESTKNKFIDLTGKKYGRLTILSFSYEKNKNYYWLTKCDCGIEKNINSRSFKTGRVVSCGCYSKEFTQNVRIPKLVEGNKQRIGENHPNWDPNKSNKERYTLRKYETSVLREKTFERDNHTCQCCFDRGGKVLNAHHIIPFSQDVDLRYDINNLITLCYNCHKQYHSKYKKNINQETLNEFRKEKSFVQ